MAGILAIYSALLILFFSGFAEARYSERSVLPVPEVAVRLQTRFIEIPAVAGARIYDGTLQRPDIVLPEGTELTETGAAAPGVNLAAQATNAGNYAAYLHLTDPETSAWADGTTDDILISWQILPLPVPKPHLTEKTLIYSGSSKTPEISGLERDFVNVSGTAQATSAGTYSVSFALADPANTCWEDGENAAFSEAWGIYVCHIGGEYFTSVRGAFDSNRSTSGTPIVMDCNWTESPVNTGGTDFFNLNQKTLTGTVENRGALTVYGGNVKQTLNGDAYALRNSGTLTVTGGTYEAVSTASATSGKEAWAVYNTAGTAAISGCTLKASGANTAVCGYQVSGGTVTSSATVNVTSNASTHGAYYAYVSGGTLNVNGGTSTVSNTAGFSYLFQAAGGTVNVSSGTHTGTAAKNGNCYLATSGTLRVSGGTSMVTAKTDCNAANASGGTITVSAGTHTALSSGGKEARALLRTTGQLTMTGGTVRAGTSGTGYGAANTTADTSATKMQVQGGQIYVRAGTAYCVQGGVQNAWIKVYSNVRFYIYYRSAHSCGSYYTGSAPQHAVLTTTSVFTYALLWYEDAEWFGDFDVESGELRIGGSLDADASMFLDHVKRGRWNVVLTAEDGMNCGVSLRCEEMMDRADDAVVGESTVFLPTSRILSIMSAPPSEGFAYDVVLGFLIPAGIEQEGHTGLMLPMINTSPVMIFITRDVDGEITGIDISAEFTEAAYLGAFADLGDEDIPELYGFPEE